MFSSIWYACKSIFNRVKNSIKKWTKPVTVTLAAGAVADLTRKRQDLLVENAILRQQLIVLKRSIKRPQFTTGDRTRLTRLARLSNFWQSALFLVQPDTILRWHRELFRLYWKWKSTPKSREPRIPRETIELIKQMARQNPRWGTKKIHGELLKLEIVVDKRTISKYIKQVRKRSGGQKPKYLIHDNDGKFGSKFRGVLKASGIKPIKTPHKAPRANALCERFVGSLKRECTDNFLIFHAPQLHKITSTYADYFNQQRPHQGINQHIPARLGEPTPPPNYQLKGKVVSTPVLNGLFHSYSYAH